MTRNTGSAPFSPQQWGSKGIDFFAIGDIESLAESALKKQNMQTVKKHVGALFVDKSPQQRVVWEDGMIDDTSKSFHVRFVHFFTTVGYFPARPGRSEVEG